MASETNYEGPRRDGDIVVPSRAVMALRAETIRSILWAEQYADKCDVFAVLHVMKNALWTINQRMVLLEDQEAERELARMESEAKDE